MSSWEAGVADRLRVRFPELGESGIKVDSDSVSVSASDESHILAIRLNNDAWVVESEDGHVHLGDADEAVEIATMLLMGNARFVNEYRSDVLAASWLEMREGDVYKTSESIAYFLSPFDIDEWELWPGEKWKQIRTVRSLVRSTGLVEISTAERTSDTPTLDPPDSTSWFSTGLGNPPEGLKWMEFKRSFVFLVPKGWRKIAKGSDEQFFDFRGPDDGLIFRARNYFRASEPQAAEKILHAVHPLSIDYTTEGTEGGWVQHTWTMIFSNGQDDMLGIIDFFYLPANEEVGLKLLPIIEAAMLQSLFVPNDWNMKV